MVLGIHKFLKSGKKEKNEKCCPKQVEIIYADFVAELIYVKSPITPRHKR
jgi:hypothetical protein